MAAAAGAGGGGGGFGEGDGNFWTNKKPMLSEQAEQARMALLPQPEQTLKCPRCDSTNTKFCDFNNYSLTQPRHFCHACRRYWTRGGALRRAKCRTKPKAAMGAAGGMSSAMSMAPSSATTCNGSATAAMPATTH